MTGTPRPSYRDGVTARNALRYSQASSASSMPSSHSNRRPNSGWARMSATRSSVSQPSLPDQDQGEVLVAPGQPVERIEHQALVLAGLDGADHQDEAPRLRGEADRHRLHHGEVRTQGHHTGAQRPVHTGPSCHLLQVGLGAGRDAQEQLGGGQVGPQPVPEQAALVAVEPLREQLGHDVRDEHRGVHAGGAQPGEQVGPPLRVVPARLQVEPHRPDGGQAQGQGADLRGQGPAAPAPAEGAPGPPGHGQVGDGAHHGGQGPEVVGPPSGPAPGRVGAEAARPRRRSGGGSHPAPPGAPPG